MPKTGLMYEVWGQKPALSVNLDASGAYKTLLEIRAFWL